MSRACRVNQAVMAQTVWMAQWALLVPQVLQGHKALRVLLGCRVLMVCLVQVTQHAEQYVIKLTLVLVGPKGSLGPAGARGPAGPTGPPGIRSATTPQTNVNG